MGQLLSRHFEAIPKNWNNSSTIAIAIEIAPRTTCNRRPPNREPTSLAAVTATSESEAIDTVRALLNANIDPALQTYESNHPLPPTYEIDDPPSPSQFLNSLDPDYDNTYPLNDFQYPLPSPTLPRSLEVS